MNDSLSHYADSLLPDPVHVLGRSLSPFCLGHALLLTKLESPFLTSDRFPQLGDLLLAIEICRHPWPRCLRFVNRPRLSLRLRIRALRHLFKSPVFILTETALLGDYIASALHCPRFWRQNEAGRTPGAPWLQAILIVLTQIGYTRDEALALPMRTAIADYFAYWEAEGVIELMNTDDHSLIEAAEAMRKEGACPN